MSNTPVTDQLATDLKAAAEGLKNGDEWGVFIAHAFTSVLAAVRALELVKSGQD